MPRLAAAAVAGGGLVMAALAACGPVEAGSAAIVGSDSITVDRLQEITNRVLENPQARSQFGDDTAELQRQVLSRLIGSELVADAAKSLALAVTPGAVDDRLTSLEQQAGGHDALVTGAAESGISPAEIRNAVRDLVLTDALAAALVKDIPVSHKQLAAAYQQNIDTYDRVHVAHILVHTKAQGERILRKVRSDPSSYPALARRLSLDTQSGANGGDLGENGINQFVPKFGTAAFAAKPGTFVLVHTQYGWHVIHVISHDTTTIADATSELRASILAGEANTRLTKLFARTADRQRIVVSPRYGTWDATQRSVVAEPNELSRPAVAPTIVPTAAPAIPGAPTPPPGG